MKSAEEWAREYWVTSEGSTGISLADVIREARNEAREEAAERLDELRQGPSASYIVRKLKE